MATRERQHEGALGQQQGAGSAQQGNGAASRDQQLNTPSREVQGGAPNGSSLTQDSQQKLRDTAARLTQSGQLSGVLAAHPALASKLRDAAGSLQGLGNLSESSLGSTASSLNNALGGNLGSNLTRALESGDSNAVSQSLSDINQRVASGGVASSNALQTPTDRAGEARRDAQPSVAGDGQPTRSEAPRSEAAQPDGQGPGLDPTGRSGGTEKGPREQEVPSQERTDRTVPLADQAGDGSSLERAGDVSRIDNAVSSERAPEMRQDFERKGDENGAPSERASEGDFERKGIEIGAPSERAPEMRQDFEGKGNEIGAPSERAGEGGFDKPGQREDHGAQLNDLNQQGSNQSDLDKAGEPAGEFGNEGAGHENPDFAPAGDKNEWPGEPAGEFGNEGAGHENPDFAQAGDKDEWPGEPAGEFGNEGAGHENPDFAQAGDKNDWPGEQAGDFGADAPDAGPDDSVWNPPSDAGGDTEGQVVEGGFGEEKASESEGLGDGLGDAGQGVGDQAGEFGNEGDATSVWNPPSDAGDYTEGQVVEGGFGEEKASEPEGLGDVGQGVGDQAGELGNEGDATSVWNPPSDAGDYTEGQVVEGGFGEEKASESEGLGDVGQGVGDQAGELGNEGDATSVWNPPSDAGDYTEGQVVEGGLGEEKASESEGLGDGLGDAGQGAGEQGLGDAGPGVGEQGLGDSGQSVGDQAGEFGNEGDATSVWNPPSDAGGDLEAQPVEGGLGEEKSSDSPGLGDGLGDAGQSAGEQGLGDAGQGAGEQGLGDAGQSVGEQGLGDSGQSLNDSGQSLNDSGQGLREQEPSDFPNSSSLPESGLGDSAPSDKGVLEADATRRDTANAEPQAGASEPTGFPSEPATEAPDRSELPESASSAPDSARTENPETANTENDATPLPAAVDPAPGPTPAAALDETVGDVETGSDLATHAISSADSIISAPATRVLSASGETPSGEPATSEPAANDSATSEPAASEPVTENIHPASAPVTGDATAGDGKGNGQTLSAASATAQAPIATSTPGEAVDATTDAASAASVPVAAPPVPRATTLRGIQEPTSTESVTAEQQKSAEQAADGGEPAAAPSPSAAATSRPAGTPSPAEEEAEKSSSGRSRGAEIQDSERPWRAVEASHHSESTSDHHGGSQQGQRDQEERQERTRREETSKLESSRDKNVQQAKESAVKIELKPKLDQIRPNQPRSAAPSRKSTASKAPTKAPDKSKPNSQHAAADTGQKQEAERPSTAELRRQTLGLRDRNWTGIQRSSGFERAQARYDQLLSEKTTNVQALKDGSGEAELGKDAHAHKPQWNCVKCATVVEGECCPSCKQARVTDSVLIDTL